MTQRREFLTRLAGIATAAAFDANELRADSVPHESDWDTSWIAKVAAAQFRAVFNASEIADGAAMNYAATFLDHFHDVHGTRDEQTRPVIVFRRLGTQMAFNDSLWNRYAIGEATKVNDPATRAPAKRNIFWSATERESAQENSTKIETLNKRGLISLVCNISLNNWSRRTAADAKLNPNDVLAEVRANLIPGAIVVPSGIYALIRAQNAGCAWMPGT
jgi:intracellular sulfur oxidation DsrE/DsrF family protein